MWCHYLYRVILMRSTRRKDSHVCSSCTISQPSSTDSSSVLWLPTYQFKVFFECVLTVFSMCTTAHLVDENNSRLNVLVFAYAIFEVFLRKSRVSSSVKCYKLDEYLLGRVESSLKVESRKVFVFFCRNWPFNRFVNGKTNSMLEWFHVCKSPSHFLLSSRLSSSPLQSQWARPWCLSSRRTNAHRRAHDSEFPEFICFFLVLLQSKEKFGSDNWQWRRQHDWWWCNLIHMNRAKKLLKQMRSNFKLTHSFGHLNYATKYFIGGNFSHDRRRKLRHKCEQPLQLKM